MALLAKYDKDQSGLIEFDEFQRLCSALRSNGDLGYDYYGDEPPTFGVGGGVTSVDLLAPKRAAFDRYDLNHSGKLDHKELRKALAHVGLSMDSEEAMALLAKYDKDQSGLIEFDEFQRLCSALSTLAIDLSHPSDAKPECLLKLELRLDGTVETFPKETFQAKLVSFLKVDDKAVRKLQLSAGSVVVNAVVAMPDEEALAAAHKRLEDTDLETLSKELDQQARSIAPSPHPPACRALPRPGPYPYRSSSPPTTPGPTPRRSWRSRKCRLRFKTGLA